MESKSNQSSGFRSLAGVLVICGLMLFPGMSFSQNVAVTDVDGYNPHASAMLDVNSTSKGLLLPRVTTAQMNAIASPAAGLMVYNTTVGAIYLYTGSSWTNLLSFGVSALTAPDGSPNNALVVDNSGRIGINQPTPSALLHLKGTSTTPDDYFRIESSTGGYYGNIFYDSQGMKFRTRNNGSAFYFQEDAGTTNMIIQDNGWVGVGNSSPWGKLEVKGDVSMNADSAIFVVRNRNGYPVFAVYDGGVRFYIDDNNGVSKGGKGGFVVGGRSTAKTAGITHDIFVLGADSARLYLEDPAKGGKGGFAVGGRTAGKAASTNFMDITPKNYFIGNESGSSITTGYYNSFMGFQTGKATTTGAWNFFAGYQAGLNNTIGNYNVFAGASSGYSNTTGSYNVFVGNQSGYYNLGGTSNQGSFNTFVGYRAGFSNTTGYMNVFMGYKSAEGETTGNSNAIIGNYAGRGLTTGSDNTYMGTWSGYNNSVGNKNVFIGYWAGIGYRDGHNNVFIGNEAGYGNNTVVGGDNNIAIGSFAGHSISTGTSNVFLGQSAGYSSASALSNVFIGYQSGYTNTASNYNAFIGYQSGYLNNGGEYNAFVGYQAGYSNSTGDWNTFMGNQAGYSNTTAFYNTFLGNLAGYKNTTAGFNTMVGYHSGYNNTTTSEHAFFGYKAGYSNTIGEDNTYLGAEAGYWVTDGSSNTYVGQIAGRQGYGSNNVYVGRGAGYSAGGSNNIFLGAGAGWSETGSNKLIIHNSATSSNTEALIYGDFSATTLRFNGNVSINAAPTSNQLYIYDGSTPNDLAAVYAIHAVTDNYGVGVTGKGGYMGVRAENTSTTGTNYGLYAYATGSGTGTRYGIYASASGGATNWAGWFAGDIRVTGSYNPSDIRLKKNISEIPGAIQKIMQMKGVYYEWDEQAQPMLLKSSTSGKESDVSLIESRNEMPKGKQIGVIAQDIQIAVPEAVRSDENGILAVDYSKLVPLLIEAVKEQQKTIEEMQKRINLLEGNGSRGIPR
ncbi:MAG: tail fiber domain-containing protein [Bacteroidales bacterium]